MKIIWIPALLTYAHTSFSQPPSELDSLKKYSYLAIPVVYKPKDLFDKPDIHRNLESVGVATAFFVKSGKKTYLGSAFHVISCFDLINVNKTRSKPDFLAIRCPFNAGGYKYIYFPIAGIHRDSIPESLFSRADVEFYEVTDLVQGLDINSIETFISKKFSEGANKTSSKIVAFGFPDYLRYNYSSGFAYMDKVSAARYEGYIADSTHISPEENNDTDHLYYVITPGSYKGTSGSPVFFLLKSGKNSWIEFAGVQSTINISYNNSMIVRREECRRKFKVKSD